jgi:hypothetical protein
MAKGKVIRALADARRAARRAVERDRRGRVRAYRAKLASRAAEPAAPASAAPRLRLLAEGDSWFDYPRILGTGGGVVDHREALTGHEILNLAHHGDEVRRMMGLQQRRRLEATLGDPSLRFDALLFSGGGNDLVGDQFCLWLRERADGMAPADAIDQQRLGSALMGVEAGYRELIAIRDRRAPGCCIVANGYDFPQPSNKGVAGQGPWLKPSLDYRGWRCRDDQFKIAKLLLLSFDGLLAGLEREQRQADRPFVYVRTQGLLNRDTDWQNEIHPNRGGFGKIARAFANALTNPP